MTGNGSQATDNTLTAIHVYYTVAWNGGTPPPEPFPWLPVAAVSVVVAAVVAVSAVVYLKKRRR